MLSRTFCDQQACAGPLAQLGDAREHESVDSDAAPESCAFAIIDAVLDDELLEFGAANTTKSGGPTSTTPAGEAALLQVRIPYLACKQIDFCDSTDQRAGPL